MRRLPTLAAGLFVLCVLIASPARGQTNPVLGWGANGFGQLGDSTAASKSVPTPAFYLSGIKQISAGGAHMLALTSDGHVYAWGYNANGQLGLGDHAARTTPALVRLLTGVIAVAAGGSHSLALTDQGQVYAWGYNGDGQLGLGDTTDRNTPTLTSLSRMKAIAGGGNHSIALGENGRIWGTGRNTSGELALGDYVSRIVWTESNSYWSQWTKAIAAGSHHTVILNAYGEVWATGDNTYGQLGFTFGNGQSYSDDFYWSNVRMVRAIAAGPTSDHTVVVRYDGAVWAWGRNQNGQLGDGTTTDRIGAVQMLNVQYARAISSGAGHTLILLANGTLMAVGANASGQLGDGTTTQRTVAVPVPGVTLSGGIAAGGTFSVAVKCCDAPKAWGKGASGQLGNGGTGNKAAPTAVSGMTGGVLAVARGANHTLFLKADGTLWVCGDNSAGQLGLGSTYGKQLKPVKLTSLSNVIAIAAGTYHSLAITADGMLWSWGGNFWGELGIDSAVYYWWTPQRADWGYIDVSAGDQHSLAIAADGSAWSCGDSFYGQLGVGLGTWRDRFTQISFGSSIAVTGLAAGGTHSLFLESDGNLWMTGRNNHGQLAFGDYTDRGVPVEQPGTLARAVAAGGEHSMHLNAFGSIFAAGSNTSGQLGVNDTADRTTWTGIGSPWIGVEGGLEHTLAFKSDGSLSAWGRNSEGELGDGSTTARLTPKPIASHPYTTGLAPGSVALHSVALSCPPIMVSSVKLSPATLTGGASSIGTVTLTAAAGAGGLTVFLSSNNAAATIPATVVVAPGAKTATFAITTKTVTAVTKVTIRATLVAVKSATLTINP